MRRTLFWACCGAIGYVYVVFPLLVIVRGWAKPRPYRSAEITPSTTVIIAARDEAAVIRAKLENVLSLDYPGDRLDVIVASDGSMDGTDELVRQHGDARVRLLSLPRRGKADALNAAIGHASGEIIVFSDANSMFAPDALRALVRPFADPDVGGVAGDQRYIGAAGGGASDGERRYWDLDRLLKRAQSRAGSATSATGAIYAVRHGLVDTVPAGVTDDFYVSTGVIGRGRRLVFAEDAVAYEAVAPSGGHEFRRKVRVITRGLRGIVVRRTLLDPRRHGFYALQLLSHKVARRGVAVPLVVLPVVSATLWRRAPLYRLATVTQLIVYAAGIIGLAGGRGSRRTPFGLAAYFCLVNAASLAAILNILRNRRIEQWEPSRSSAGNRMERDGDDERA